MRPCWILHVHVCVVCLFKIECSTVVNDFFLGVVWFSLCGKDEHFFWSYLVHLNVVTLMLLLYRFLLSIISWSIALELNELNLTPLFLTSGVYAAAYDTNIEWVIVKGVASYFHHSQAATSEWMSFASSMAASVVAKMLIDPRVFRKWRHYNQGKSYWQNRS